MITPNNRALVAAIAMTSALGGFAIDPLREKPRRMQPNAEREKSEESKRVKKAAKRARVAARHAAASKAQQGD